MSEISEFCFVVFYYYHHPQSILPALELFSFVIFMFLEIKVAQV